MVVEREFHLKRVVDVFGAALGLALFSPVPLIGGLLIRLTMGRPVLYVSQRPGLGARIFRLHKSRTMTNDGGPDFDQAGEPARTGTLALSGPRSLLLVPMSSAGH